MIIVIFSLIMMILTIFSLFEFSLAPQLSIFILQWMSSSVPKRSQKDLWLSRSKHARMSFESPSKFIRLMKGPWILFRHLNVYQHQSLCTIHTIGLKASVKFVKLLRLRSYRQDRWYFRQNESHNEWRGCYFFH